MLCDELGPDGSRPNEVKACLALQIALEGMEPESQVLGAGALQAESPRWPSTLHPLDSRTGGFYGLATIYGPGKSGKSMLALGSAIQAAASGRWYSFYMNAEYTRSELENRFARYASVRPEAYDAVDWMRIIHVADGVTRRQILDRIQEGLGLGEPRGVLVVLDSTNAIAEAMGGGYFGALHSLTRWLATARRITEGLVSGIIVSETNQKGSVKGRKLEYSSDIGLSIKPIRETAFSVDVDVPWAREGGAGPVGRYVRDWQRCRLISEQQIGLSAIDGGRA